MRLAVLVLEDEPEVRAALLRDLAAFDPPVRVEPAENVEDARAVLRELAAVGDALALVLADHRLPGTTGVELLVELHGDPEHSSARKVLVTGQADQQDTIRAVNEAGLDRYVTKPWDAEELVALVRSELTSFVLAEDLDPLPYLPALDAARGMPALRGRGDR